MAAEAECRRPARRLVLAQLVVLSAVVVIVAGFGVPHVGVFRCVFHELTGLYCPGCGATRALRALSHGQVWVAFCYNPLLVCALPGLLAWYAATLRAHWSGTRPPAQPDIPAAAVWALLGLVLLYFVARNLPWVPYCYLAPGALLR